jgi:bifunctional non-homologous end joining protein LigD
VSRSSAVRKKKKIGPSDLTGAQPARVPKLLTPELATLVSEAPEGDDWVHEIKLDGYRLLAFADGDDVRLVSRNGKDWTGSVPVLEQALAELSLDRAVLDGELVCLDPSGKSSFQLLQNALGLGTKARLAYFAFDLLFFGGFDLRAAPLLERKELLVSILPESRVVRYSHHVTGGGREVLASACEMGAEGIVSKRAGSAYHSRRTRDWLKVKCLQRQELVIGGYTDPQGSRSGFGALLLGYYERGKLVYCGKVGTGFNARSLSELTKKLRAIEVKATAFANPPRGAEARSAHWVKPELVAEISFTEWTGDGHLRHPSFQGLRVDKRPEEVKRERPK